VHDLVCDVKQTPVFEWGMVGCESMNDHNLEGVRGNLSDLFITERIFTSTIKRIISYELRNL
jgi:hypothetical protein